MAVELYTLEGTLKPNESELSPGTSAPRTPDSVVLREDTDRESEENPHSHPISDTFSPNTGKSFNLPRYLYSHLQSELVGLDALLEY